MKKNAASAFLKNVISLLSSIAKAKAKSMAIRSKTGAVKDRLIMLSLLKNKKLPLEAISHKIHALVAGKGGHNNIDVHSSKAVVPYNTNNNVLSNIESHQLKVEDNDDDDDKYPNLRPSVCDNDEEEDELDFGDPTGSVIDLVRNSKEEGENFSLEDEIDHVADLFIMKFHKQMRIQKLLSFKRYQDMLERSA